jgi:hypothetical protein
VNKRFHLRKHSKKKERRSLYDFLPHSQGREIELLKVGAFTCNTRHLQVHILKFDTATNVRTIGGFFPKLLVCLLSLKWHLDL